jgi:putative membrane protein
MIHPAFKVSDWKNGLIVVVSFGILNFLFRKILNIFTLGIAYVLYILTLGISGLIINAIVLLIISKAEPEMIIVPGFKEAFFGGAALAVANFIGSR